MVGGFRLGSKIGFLVSLKKKNNDNISAKNTRFKPLYSDHRRLVYLVCQVQRRVHCSMTQTTLHRIQDKRRVKVSRTQSR